MDGALACDLEKPLLLSFVQGANQNDFLFDSIQQRARLAVGLEDILNLVEIGE